MPSVETIYQQTILPLPPSDRVRLAEIIMERAAKDSSLPTGRESALDLLEGLSAERIFEDSDSVDRYVRSERESWDN